MCFQVMFRKSVNSEINIYLNTLSKLLLHHQGLVSSIQEYKHNYKEKYDLLLKYIPTISSIFYKWRDFHFPSFFLFYSF